MAKALVATLFLTLSAASLAQTNGQAPATSRTLPRLPATLPGSLTTGTSQTPMIQIEKRLPLTDAVQKIWVRKEGHEYIYQDDIIVGDDLPKPIFLGTGDQDDRWKDGVIPVVIDSSVSMQVSALGPVLEALNTMNVQTEMQFKPRTNEEDYVRIIMAYLPAGVAARSHVGRAGGRQDLKIGRNSTGGYDQGWGKIAHEMMHASGVYHEQSRKDRQSFVRINEQNILEQGLHNFDQESGKTVGTYDYCSIMHYDKFVFSSNGQTTIDCKSGSSIVPCPVCMGGRDALSTQDIAGLDALYSEISRFSHGGYDGSYTEDISWDASGALTGSVFWSAKDGMPKAPNWGNGTVDYVSMSVEAPTRRVITWSGGKRTESLTSRKKVGSLSFSALAQNADERKLGYQIASIPRALPLTVSIDVPNSRWGGFPPAPAICGGAAVRCSYGMSASSATSGAILTDNTGVARKDFRVEGIKTTTARQLGPYILQTELVERLINNKDWVMKTPVQSIEKIKVIRQPARQLPTR